MICAHCGHTVSDGARFCENCGAAVFEEAAPAPEKAEQGIRITGRKVTENIYLCPDGRYRWVYEFRMLKNPTILFTVLKVILLAYAIVMGFLLLVNLISGDFRYWVVSDYWENLRVWLILLLVMLALGVVAYLILAASFGWSYMVLFTMDEDSVEFRTMGKQVDRAAAWGWLTAAAGLATGNIGRAGTGILAATRTTSVSVFAQVRRVKAVRRRKVIYVNQRLNHNQIYAGDADFDFVRNYITGRCKNAKITG